MAKEETSLNSEPDEATRSYRRAGVLGFVLFLTSVLYLFISPSRVPTPAAVSTGPAFLDLAMQLGFVASYVLLLVGVAGVAHAGPASVFVALISNGYVLVSALQFF